MAFIDTKIVTDFLEKNAFGKCEFCNNYDMCKYINSRKGSHKNCWQAKRFPIIDFEKDNTPHQDLTETLCRKSRPADCRIC